MPTPSKRSSTARSQEQDLGLRQAHPRDSGAHKLAPVTINLPAKLAVHEVQVFEVKLKTGELTETPWQPTNQARPTLPVALDLAGLYEQMLHQHMLASPRRWWADLEKASFMADRASLIPLQGKRVPPGGSQNQEGGPIQPQSGTE